MEPAPSGPTRERRTILVADDSAASRDLLCRQLSLLGFWTEAVPGGQEAAAAARQRQPDLIVLDIQMPDDYQRLKADPSTAAIPVLMVTEVDSLPAPPRLEAAGDDLIARPVRVPELQFRVRALLRLTEVRHDLRRTHERLRELVQQEDPGESKTPLDAGVAGTARALARLIGLDAEDQEIAYYAGLLHDIGQIRLPAELLNKQGTLTSQEYEQVQRHTVLGAELAGPSAPPVALAAAIRHHHERWDGTGYPDKLPGPSIPVVARIVAVGDGLHALVTDRPYRGRLSLARALEMLSWGSGTQWDPQLVAALANSSLPERIAGVSEPEDQVKSA